MEKIILLKKYLVSHKKIFLLGKKKTTLNKKDCSTSTHKHRREILISIRNLITRKPLCERFFVFCSRVKAKKKKNLASFTHEQEKFTQFPHKKKKKKTT